MDEMVNLEDQVLMETQELTVETEEKEVQEGMELRETEELPDSRDLEGIEENLVYPERRDELSTAKTETRVCVFYDRYWTQ